MTQEFDLGARSRARAEKLGDGPTFLFGDPEERFQLAAELPAVYMEHLEVGRVTHAVRCAFPDEGEAQRFFALEPTVADCIDLTNAITEMYLGVTSGESVASGSSSKQGSGSSRRRSKAATA